MAIIRTAHNFTTDFVDTYEFFAGRVLRVEKTVETRNWSDTMDYTDYRTTNCTYALVWLGTHNVPAEGVDTARPRVSYELLQVKELSEYSAAKVRDLEYFEQFAWVDCTNLHSDRMGSRLSAKSDAAPFIAGEPLMWANLLAWEGYQKSLAEKRLREMEAAAELARKVKAENEAKAAARNAKRETKVAATKVVADAELAAALPVKGKTVTVDGFTGTVFWMGVRQYRGTWNANAGIKDSKGDVKWVRCNQLTK